MKTNDAHVFLSPRNIVWGRGCTAYLEAVPGSRALIITDKMMTQIGLTEKVAAYLKSGGKRVEVFDDVEPEPTFENVLSVVEKYKDYEPELIIGLGGGSSIDASKCFRVFYEHPEITPDILKTVGKGGPQDIPPYTKTVHAAISSTSGTGSEVTKACIITDKAKNEKCAIFAERCIPDIAILDPEITASMPKRLATDTGLDALTHAIESYVALNRNAFSLAESLYAIKIIIENIEASVLDGNSDSRELMHYAACLAGIGFSNSANGLAHTVGDKVGKPYKLTHGRACIISLPHVMRFNRDAALKEYAEIARYLGFNGSDEDAADYIIKEVERIMKALDVEMCYKDAGIDADDYYKNISEFAKESMTFPPALRNPRQATLDEMEELYKKCYEGEVR